MRAVILVENTAPPALEREHGLSVYVEHRGRRVLLDAGHSGKFARNAEKLGVDLSRVDTAVLSHGHYDHADGLDVFFSQVPDIPVRARPAALSPQYHAERYIGLKGELLERFRGRVLLDDRLLIQRQSATALVEVAQDSGQGSRCSQRGHGQQHCCCSRQQEHLAGPVPPLSRTGQGSRADFPADPIDPILINLWNRQSFFTSHIPQTQIQLLIHHDSPPASSEASPGPGSAESAPPPARLL